MVPSAQKMNRDEIVEFVKAEGKVCREPKSRDEIMDFLGMKHREHFRTEILSPLLEAGLLAPTIPE
jgi:ATP-dependent DNA helicase RecG